MMLLCCSFGVSNSVKKNCCVGPGLGNECHRRDISCFAESRKGGASLAEKFVRFGTGHMQSSRAERNPAKRFQEVLDGRTNKRFHNKSLWTKTHVQSSSLIFTSFDDVHSRKNHQVEITHPHGCFSWTRYQLVLTTKKSHGLQLAMYDEGGYISPPGLIVIRHLWTEAAVSMCVAVICENIRPCLWAPPLIFGRAPEQNILVSKSSVPIRSGL